MKLGAVLVSVDDTPTIGVAYDIIAEVIPPPHAIQFTIASHILFIHVISFN